MIQDYVESLLVAVSADRLEAYRPTPEHDDLTMVVNYLWNIVLCEALYPSLHTLEVSLRNAIHAGLTELFNTEEWYDHAECLELRQQHVIIDTKIDIINRKGKRGITPGRVISGLQFGFWTTLLNDPYERRLWRKERYFLLKKVFPDVPKHMRTRDKLFHEFDQFRELRNRVFHFEPILSRPDLMRDYQRILEAISWINPVMRETLNLCDRFPDIHQNGRALIEARFKQHIETL